ncbi:MAG: dCMP deaminase family protein [Bacilli bacterium]|jgi:dCMP deaminase|nr:dCMP deaminase family protein [Bacilli bacterium]
MMGQRVSFDEYFMQLAHLVASRSTCLSRSVGAVIVRDNHIIATGYNGAPRGVSHCLDTGCIRREHDIPSGERLDICKAVHAEQNAIIEAAYNGVSTKGASIYVTVTPCFTCAKMLVNAGIKEIIIDGDYPSPSSRSLFEEVGIKLKKL